MPEALRRRHRSQGIPPSFKCSSQRFLWNERVVGLTGRVTGEASEEGWGVGIGGAEQAPEPS